MEDDNQSTATSTAPAADTSATDDTSTSQTSTDAETQETDQAALLDKAFGLDETDADATQSNPDESTDSEDEASSETKDDATNQDETAQDSEGESEDDKTEDKDRKDPSEMSKEERQAFNDEQAKRRIEQADKAKEAKLSQQQEYLDEATNDEELERRQDQITAYNKTIEVNETKLQSGIQLAVATIDLFKTGDKDVQEDLASSLDEFDRLHVVRDRNGDPVEVTGNIQEFLQNKAASIERYIAKGERKARANNARTTAAALPTPARSTPPKKKDAVMDALSSD